MKKVLISAILCLLISSTVFANDVIIDSSGNVTTGVNASGNIEVNGASGETGVFSQTSGTGAIAVRGENTSYGSFGTLGGYENPQDVGVYGYSLGGWAGYFEGDVHITGIIRGNGSKLTDISWYSLIDIPAGFDDGQDGDCNGIPCALTSSLMSNCTKVGAGPSGELYCSPETLPVWSINGSDTYYNSGNVGIGTSTPTEKLTVDGIIESSSGGIKFPDGTIQTTASSTSLTYLRTVIVSPVPGDAIASGTALLSALAGITGATSTNPYLLKIEPGIYDLGNNGLSMKSYVDIEGSGENTTTITSTHSSGTSDETSATVAGAHFTEMRFLTVENLGGAAYALAVFNNFAAPKITNVTATASGGSAANYGIYNHYYNSTMTNVTATASGSWTGNSIAVLNFYSYPTMTNVTTTASMGNYSYGVKNNNSSPTMTNVTATASAVTTSYGVYNSASSPTMTNVTATVSGGASNRGVHNYNSSSPTMTNVTTTASGGTPGASNYGVFNDYNASPTIKNSSISGTSYSIYNGTGSGAKVGATMLDGAVIGGGFTCVGAYDASYTALETNCL